MRNASDKREKIETHILCSITSFTENLAIYEIMWKNIMEPNSQRMTIRGNTIKYWIPKATDTHSEYVILIAFSSATVVA